MTDYYCTLDDVKANLPFKADDTNFPNDAYISGAQKAIHRVINGYLGIDEDLTSETGAVGGIEALKTADRITAQVYGEKWNFNLSEAEKEILAKDKKINFKIKRIR